jgi:SAM-dependent methyltransferase
MPDRAWVWRALACPRCHGRLVPALNLVRCATCGPFPLLGEVAVLVPDPAQWCATFHDAILATLAEHGTATREAVHVVQAFARGSVEPSRFGDDWTEFERRGEPPPVPVRGPANATLQALMHAGLTDGPGAWVEKHLVTCELAVEIGCGAGQRSEVLSQRSRRLIVGDYSLRAVLQAGLRAARGPATVTQVVLDAAALPLAAGLADVVVAENVVDLLEDPLAFLEGVRRALKKQGRALITSPDPSLGSGDDGALRELALRAKLKVSETREGLPWLRTNSTRHLETYLVQAMVARRNS